VSAVQLFRSEDTSVGESFDSPGDASASARAPLGWTDADTETVLCCLCQVPGTPVYDLAPFALVRCPNCDLSFVSPRLTADALQRLYDEPAYFEGGVYGAQSRWSPAMVLQRAWMAGRLAEIESVRSSHGPSGKGSPARSRSAGGSGIGGSSVVAPGVLGSAVDGSARLLEIGSGYGLFLAAAREEGYHVTGVELSRTGVAHARSRLGVEVFCGQLENAPSANALPFDVICFWDTLEHVPDPLVFLRHVRSRLAAEGIFALSIPDISSLPAKLLRHKWWTLKPEQHIWHFTPATLRLLANRAGLEVTDVITSPVSLGNVGRLDSLVAIGRPLAEVKS
jgi:SAM-dependent methyltransferase